MRNLEYHEELLTNMLRQRQAVILNHLSGCEPLDDEVSTRNRNEFAPFPLRLFFARQHFAPRTLTLLPSNISPARTSTPPGPRRETAPQLPSLPSSSHHASAGRIPAAPAPSAAGAASPSGGGGRSALTGRDRARRSAAHGRRFVSSPSDGGRGMGGGEGSVAGHPVMPAAL